jgi:hypothetical protein
MKKGPEGPCPFPLDRYRFRRGFGAQPMAKEIARLLGGGTAVRLTEGTISA